MHAEELGHDIDVHIGEGSNFHDIHGYYAQGVNLTTATLPRGWEGRLTRVRATGADNCVAYCIDVLDLFMAKCAANREKDRDFNVVLLREGLVTARAALDRVPDMPIDDAAKTRMLALIGRLAQAASPK